MDYSFVKKDPLCFGGIDGFIEITVSNYRGKLFLNWINLPQNALVSHDGLSVRNISSGKYRVEIEDDEFFGQNKKLLDIELQQPKPLSIDFVQVSYPKCYTDSGEIKVFISGGSPPYVVSSGHRSTITDNVAIFNNIPNDSFFDKISVRDSHECSIEYNQPITLNTKPINIGVVYKNLIRPNEKSALVKAYIKNGTPPYKIGWFDSNNNRIASNTDNLKNMLPVGSYSIKVIDANNCTNTEYFDIEAPKPISVNYVTKADYSHNSFFSFAKILKIHNLILIPKNKYPKVENLIPGNSVDILIKNKKIKQSVVLETGFMNLDNIDYFYFYIGNGIKITDRIAFAKKDYSLSIDDKNITLSLVMDNKKTSKLLIGCLVLDKNLDYAFRNKDILQANIDNQIIPGKLNIKLNKHNFYEPLKTNTLLLIDYQYNTNILYALNSINGFNAAYIRSLTTKKNNQKGSIHLKITGGIGNGLGVLNSDGEGYRYKVYCKSIDNTYNQTFYTNHLLDINSLDCGHYIIRIEDMVGNNIDFVNNMPVVDNEFNFRILGSIEEEQKTIANQMSQINHITMNQSSPLPRFKRVSRPMRNKANLLINIKPLDTHPTLYGPNNFVQKLNSGYELIPNLDPGKYSIKAEDQTKDFFLVQNDTYHLNSMD